MKDRSQILVGLLVGAVVWFFTFASFSACWTIYVEPYTKRFQLSPPNAAVDLQQLQQQEQEQQQQQRQQQLQLEEEEEEKLLKQLHLSTANATDAQVAASRRNENIVMHMNQIQSEFLEVLRDMEQDISDMQMVAENVKSSLVPDLLPQNRQSRDLRCVRWRHTSDCDPNGSRLPEHDLPCDSTQISYGFAGYCEVVDAHTREPFRVMSIGCDSLMPSTNLSCEMASEYAKFAIQADQLVQHKMTRGDSLPHLPSLQLQQQDSAAFNHATAKHNGIVMVAYPEMLASLYATVRSLRQLHCSLPIEIWYRPEELTQPHKDAILGELVHRFAPISLQPITNPKATGFKSKVYAVYHSQFRHVLFLDSDNIPLRDPTFLFESSEFLADGAMFWPDVWNPRSSVHNIHRDSLLWQYIDLPFVDMFEQDSAQVLINRARHAQALELLLVYNFYEPNLFESLQLVHGDKDLFRLAWVKTNSSFYMVPTLPSIGGQLNPDTNQFCGMALVQYDPIGDMLFFHRNGMKLTSAMVNADDTHQDKIWTHIQRFKKNSPVTEFKIGSFASHELLPKADACIGALGDVLPHFELIPVKYLPLVKLEDQVLAFAQEAISLDQQQKNSSLSLLSYFH